MLGQTKNLKVLGLCVLAVLALNLVSCTFRKKKDEAVAQVGSAVLTQSDLRSQFPPEFENMVTKEQYLHYIKRWMDEEVLYQKAQEQDYEEREDIQNRIRALTKKIVVETYLADQQKNWKYDPEDHLLSQYYDVHFEDFARRETEVQFAVLQFTDPAEAKKVSKEMNADNFQEYFNQYGVKGNSGMGQAHPFFPAGAVDSCYADQVFSTKVGSNTSPITCEGKVMVVRLLDKKTKGTLRTLPEVSEEIRSILKTEWQQRELDKVIAKLREEMFFTTNLSLIPGKANHAIDTSKKSDSK